MSAHSHDADPTWRAPPPRGGEREGWDYDARPRSPRRPRRERYLLLALGAAILLALVLSIVAPVSRPLNPLKQPAMILVSADGQPIARRGAYKDVPVRVEELPRHVGDAFVAIEDRRFYRHAGIDLRGIMRAAFANSRAGEVVQGGSTITQQLARTAYLDQKRTLSRKLRETVIALWLEIRLSKREILSAYLSSVYFGDGVYGLRAAARHYFGKAPEALTLSESAMLAGVVKAPSRLNPVENPREAGRRARLVLTTMTETGSITEAEAKRAGRVRVRLERASLPVGTYFADWVAPAARAAAPRDFGETVVHTTLDLGLQRKAEAVVRRALGPYPRTQAALVAMTPDGAVRAMVGGRSYGRSQFNRAAQAKRQPGSAFKTFVYLAALREGHRLDELILDEPIRQGRWRPRNFNGAYAGRITLREAFARSSNVAAVRLAQDVGVRDVAAAARDLGIASKLGRDATLALGTSETSLLELTAAYAAIAAGRAPVRPYGVATTEALPEGRPIEPAHQAALLALLASAVYEGTGREAALLVPTFGKTGTTQDHRDAIFVGFVEGLVVGVWVGNDDRTPMKGITGGGLPAKIWRALMVELGFPPASPARPAFSSAPMFVPWADEPSSHEPSGPRPGVERQERPERDERWERARDERREARRQRLRNREEDDD